MKKKITIALNPFEGNMFLRNKIFSINHEYIIFFGLKKYLSEKNIEINTIDLISPKIHIDKYVFCDTPLPWKLKIWNLIFPNKSKNILFCFESPIINPFNQLGFIHNLFSKIYTWDDTIIDNKTYFKLYIPQRNKKIDMKTKEFNNKKFLVIINGKKSLPFLLRIFSLGKINLFNERLKIINFLDSHLPSKFFLYGIGWDKPDPFKITEKFFGFKQYKTYKGPIPENGKLEILSQFKFCICFENTCADGYITEKIFDCFKARCIPIYWGAPNITRYINKNCFIDFREFMDYSKLLKYLNNISEEEYRKYIQNINTFLKDPETRRIWFEEGFRKTFLKSII